MWDVSAEFLKAVRTSHTPVVRVRAFLAGKYLADVPGIVGGQVVVDGRAQTSRRSLTLEIDNPALIPRTEADLLGPNGVELLVERGVEYTNHAVEYAPLGVFSVEEPRSLLRGGRITVTGVDRGAIAAASTFLQPERSVVGTRIPEEISRLLRSAIPAATIVDQSGATARTPPSVYDDTFDTSGGRWAAAGDLGTSIGCEVIPDQIGRFVIRPAPSLDDQPVPWPITTGADGVLLPGGVRIISRKGIYNAVVVTGERTDGTPPVSVIVYDTDPRSLTRWGGPMGKRPRRYTSPLITTAAQARAAGLGILARSRGFVRRFELTVACNPALDAGDVVPFEVDPDKTERVLIDRLTIPLLDPAMTVEARSSRRSEDDPE